jgi:hypothetical protein
LNNSSEIKKIIKYANLEKNPVFYYCWVICNSLNAQGFASENRLTQLVGKILYAAVLLKACLRDIKYYHLDIKVNPADSTISGICTIKYQVLDEYHTMQIDLQKYRF